MKQTVIALVLVCLWGSACSGAEEGPPASLFAGKAVLVSCFQSWCPGCRSYDIPMTKLLMDKYKSDPRFIARRAAPLHRKVDRIYPTRVPG
jgi:thiol-disulfide isomerase/thioredoxin